MSIFSYNYLKGINLFEKTRTFKIVYTKVDGLSPSNPVTLNGYKIGKVQKINFNPNDTKELIVDVIIENDVKFSNNKCNFEQHVVNFAQKLWFLHKII